MVGGGSLFFYAQERSYAPQYWISDINPLLIQFYKACQDEFECLLVRETCRTFRSLRAVAYAQVPYASDASTFFIRNRCSFSGSTEAGGVSKDAGMGGPNDRFTSSCIERLMLLPQALKGVRITFDPVLCVLDEARNGDFVYLDPPYVTAKKLYGPSGALHDFDHDRLAAELKEAKYKFLLSYDNCDKVKELYSWANIVELTLPYSAGRKKQGKEVLILNYEVPKT
jgi:DNA adenine methylase